MKLHFKEYGSLKWLEPADFYADGWSHYESATAEDGETYDIVISLDKTELRYTAI